MAVKVSQNKMFQPRVLDYKGFGSVFAKLEQEALRVLLYKPEFLEARYFMRVSFGKEPPPYKTL